MRWGQTERRTQSYPSLLLLSDVGYLLNNFLQVLILAENQGHVELLLSGERNQFQCQADVDTFFLEEL